MGNKATDSQTGKPIKGVKEYIDGKLIAITDKNGKWRKVKNEKGGEKMAEKKDKETRPYSPEQLVEVLERIAEALESINKNVYEIMLFHKEQ